jgi:8-oxo-dGTP diphosphatase
VEKGGKEKTSVKREFSAGGVVFKKEKDSTFWLITKSSPSELIPKSAWRLPKGRLDDTKDNEPGVLASGKKKASEEQIQKAAVKEVEEEGGVKARVVEKIGTIKYFFKLSRVTILKFVTFYLMEYDKDLESGFGPETLKVEWLEFDKARAKLDYSNERKVLDDARDIISKSKV